MFLSKNVLLLLFLYFIQGLPYGFQVQFLPLHLHSMGVDLTNIGLMRLFHAPWLCKALWAPFIDKYWTKRKWLLASITGLIITSFASCFVSSKSITSLCIILFLLNLFASTQDIAVDGIAVSLLASHELGTGNTAQVVGYKIGSIFGGGVLVWFMDILGWSGLFLALTVLYIEAFMFVFVSPSLRYQESRLLQWQTTQEKVESWQEASYYFNDPCSEEDVDEFGESHDSFNGSFDRPENSLLVHTVQCTEQCDDNCSDEAAAAKKNGSYLGYISTELGKAQLDSSQTVLTQRTTQIHRTPHPFPNSYGGNTFLENDSEDDDILDAEDLERRIKERTQMRKSMITLFKSVISVQGTGWLAVFVLIYKLGEQGALGMMPLYLIERQMSTSEVSFWTGIIGQAASIFGSLLGGWIVTNNRMPVDFVLQQICLLRLFPLGIQFLTIVLWNLSIIPAYLLFYVAVGSLILLMLLSGMITTATFTLMMQCSRLAAPTLQATHYTTLATVEVFGKLAFMTMAGWLVDRLGFPFMFFMFVLLTALSSYWFYKCPHRCLSGELNPDVDLPGSSQRNTKQKTH